MLQKQNPPTHLGDMYACTPQLDSDVDVVTYSSESERAGEENRREEKKINLSAIELRPL